MPTFDFRCAKDHMFEASIPFGSKKRPKCPACGEKTEKLLTPPLGIVFKGSGFYKTDSETKETKETRETKESTASASSSSHSSARNRDAETTSKENRVNKETKESTESSSKEKKI